MLTPRWRILDTLRTSLPELKITSSLGQRRARRRRRRAREGRLSPCTVRTFHSPLFPPGTDSI